MTVLELPTADGAGRERYTLTQRPAFVPTGAPFQSRVLYAAAHIVADPEADNGPGKSAVLDWEATLRYRHHLWSNGFGVAEAMDTAQRGMGLGWDTAKELIARSLAEAKSVGGQVTCGAGTDHLDRFEGLTLEKVTTAYETQRAFVEGHGGRIVLMASRALAAVAKSADDYLEVYGRILSQVSQPVILHWLGEMFDPSLAGYWGSADWRAAMETCLELIEGHRSKVDGIKISLLDADKEVALRRKLPVGTQSSTAPQQVTATYSVGDTALRAEAAIPVLTGVRIPAGDFGARAADFSLQSAGDIVNTNDIDPATNQLTWKGPQDLSARAWLGRGQNALRLRFEVRDDAARQPYVGKEMWQGDGIQMALAVPGQGGSFEIGLARGDNGRPAVHSWSSPRGFKGADIVKAVMLQTRRQGDLTIYEVLLPYAAFGLSDQMLRQGVRFSFVVNDLDDARETTREGYLRLSDGLATQKDTLRFPTVVVE